MKFIALDVETANADIASICQVGIAWYEDGLLVKEWMSYLDPQDYFSPINISIHGIDENKVAGAPTFEESSQELFNITHEQLVVSHTHFDRVSLLRAYNKKNLLPPECTWIDSAHIARHTWDQFRKKRYGLENVCGYLGYEFNAHDALEDAKAAGHITISAMKYYRLDLEGLVLKIQKQIASKSNIDVKRNGNPYGPLYGERLVFTGALEIPRHKAADMAAMAGCRVDQGVTKKT